MGNLFGNTVEMESVAYLKAGIHTFKINDIYFQKTGASVKGIKKKDGNVLDYKFDCIIINADVLVTHLGGESKGANTNLSILMPKMDDDKEKNAGRISRIFHILVNIAPSAKKEDFRAWLQKQDFKGDTFEKMFENIPSVVHKFIVGKTVRYKLIADKDGKGAYFPSYFKGFAEPADIDFLESTLKWDDAKEGNIKKGETEKLDSADKKEVDDLFGAAPASTPTETASEDSFDLF